MGSGVQVGAGVQVGPGVQVGSGVAGVLLVGALLVGVLAAGGVVTAVTITVGTAVGVGVGVAFGVAVGTELAQASTVKTAIRTTAGKAVKILREIIAYRPSGSMRWMAGWRDVARMILAHRNRSVGRRRGENPFGDPNPGCWTPGHQEGRRATIPSRTPAPASMWPGCGKRITGRACDWSNIVSWAK